jgi:type I restriction enzyme S subunit
MKNWERKKLGEVVEVLDNLRKPITKRDRVGGEYPYYGATGILSYVHNYIFSEKLVLIGEDGAKWASGDNTSFIVEGKYWVNNHAHAIRPNRKVVLDEWIVYFLNFSDLTPFITGMTVPKLNQEKMKSIPIPIPPLPEQQRIVSILDEAFAAIAKAKANAEQNLKNAKELFESYLQGVFEKKGDGWEERKVKDIGFAQTGTTPKTAEKENYGDFIPFIKPADIDFSCIGDIRYDNEGLSEIGLKKGRKIESGSILMVCIGATIGKVGFAEHEVSCNQQINSLTVKKEFEPKFIYYAMTSREFQDKILLEGKGAQATLPIINKSKWENLTISFPKSKTEQKVFIEKFDALRAETQKLEALYQQKIADLEELKKSILQKAFAGELKT